MIATKEKLHRAFLKWAGGKGQLVEQIFALVPPVHSGRLIEPFVGSGILTLNAREYGFTDLIIADTNDALIALWSQLKWNKDFIEAAKLFFHPTYNHEATYYTLRERFNNALKHWNEQDVACLFLYLNRHGFNGLCRFNAKGGFNVPYGRYDKPYFPLAELYHAMEMMKDVRILHQGFAETMSEAKEGDVIYCDPPYLPLSASSNFTAYSKGGFSYKDQGDLVLAAKAAQKVGATVMISNNDTSYARTLYADATEKYYPDVRKAISCKANGRKKQREILAVFRP